tara:strand:- start:922 stop:2379 length:1458 start_codon:yes stop_codon:yes gene_type:complete
MVTKNINNRYTGLRNLKLAAGLLAGAAIFSGLSAAQANEYRTMADRLNPDIMGDTKVDAFGQLLFEEDPVLSATQVSEELSQLVDLSLSYRNTEGPHLVGEDILTNAVRDLTTLRRRLETVPDSEELQTEIFDREIWVREVLGYRLNDMGLFDLSRQVAENSIAAVNRNPELSDLDLTTAVYMDALRVDVDRLMRLPTGVADGDIDAAQVYTKARQFDESIDLEFRRVTNALMKYAMSKGVGYQRGDSESSPFATSTLISLINAHKADQDPNDPHPIYWEEDLFNTHASEPDELLEYAVVVNSTNQMAAMSLNLTSVNNEAMRRDTYDSWLDEDAEFSRNVTDSVGRTLEAAKRAIDGTLEPYEVTGVPNIETRTSFLERFHDYAPKSEEGQSESTLDTDMDVRNVTRHFVADTLSNLIRTLYDNNDVENAVNAVNELGKYWLLATRADASQEAQSSPENVLSNVGTERLRTAYQEAKRYVSATE